MPHRPISNTEVETETIGNRPIVVTTLHSEDNNICVPEMKLESRNAKEVTEVLNL